MTERLYHVVAINDRTGKRTLLTQRPEPHDAACRILSKQSEACRRRARLQLEEVPHELRAATFTFDDGTSFAGYDDGLRWNGWAVPFLPRSEVDRLAAYLAREGSQLGRLDYQRIETVDGPRVLARINEGLTFWGPEHHIEREV